MKSLRNTIKNIVVVNGTFRGNFKHGEILTFKKVTKFTQNFYVPTLNLNNGYKLTITTLVIFIIKHERYTQHVKCNLLQMTPLISIQFNIPSFSHTIVSTHT